MAREDFLGGPLCFRIEYVFWCKIKARQRAKEVGKSKQKFFISPFTKSEGLGQKKAQPKVLSLDFYSMAIRQERCYG